MCGVTERTWVWRAGQRGNQDDRRDLWRDRVSISRVEKVWGTALRGVEDEQDSLWPGLQSRGVSQGGSPGQHETGPGVLG